MVCIGTLKDLHQKPVDDVEVESEDLSSSEEDRRILPPLLPFYSILVIILPRVDFPHPELC